MKHSRKLSTATITAIMMSLSLTAHASQNKIPVGAVEYIHVSELGLHFDSRIDTGAKSSSLHATNIQVEDSADNKQNNIGKTISFTTANENGEEIELISSISSVNSIRSAQGVETRYSVPLTLILDGKEKSIEVNLRDRSHMKYKLLVGRDWLKGDYLVDVDFIRTSNCVHQCYGPAVGLVN